MIYCPNPNCQTLNPEAHQFCQNCRTPLPRRYVWAVGDTGVSAGQVLVDRYQCVEGQIFLDTKPGLQPNTPADLPAESLPYLHLSPYQLHVPQIYGILSAAQVGGKANVLLLEQAAIAAPVVGQERRGPQLFPPLAQAWPSASGLRQVSWLRQIASLWQPLEQEQVGITLLNPQLLRVDGSTVRLLELHSNATLSSSAPGLKQLGQFWQGWIDQAQPELAPVLKQICQQLMQGDLRTAEQLIAVLDQELAQWGRSQTRHVQIATQTDQGPTRQRNEDACFPESGTHQSAQLASDQAPTSGPQPLVIVCDGIGGHEGGNVASQLAIETVQQHLHPLLDREQRRKGNSDLTPVLVTTELELAICAANDAISQRNDQEQRYDRQRMGTTLVMALTRAYELYIAHLGDSRAYRITRQECRQVTLDDDVAAREVRLGYALYRDAVQQPGAGSLVQALGMGSSNYLYPSVQHFVLDEDCLFLLCSDGLSDNDLVEACWQTELLPVLEGKRDLATATQRLVEIANSCNGYDNVTVGLLYCQVHDPTLSQVLPVPATATESSRTQVVAPASVSPTQKTQQTLQLPPRAKPAKAQPRKSAAGGASVLTTLLGILVLLGLGGLLAYLLFPGVGQWVDAVIQRDRNPITEQNPGEQVPLASTPPSRQSLLAGTLLLVQRSTIATEPNGELAVLTLRGQPTLSNSDVPPEVSPAPTSSPVREGTVPAGSVLRVMTTKRQSSEEPLWVQLQVCSVPSTAAEAVLSPEFSNADSDSESAIAAPDPETETAPVAPSNVLLQPGDTGWILEEQIVSVAQVGPALEAAQRGICDEAP